MISCSTSWHIWFVFSDEDSVAFSFYVFCIEKMSATVSIYIWPLEVLLSGFQIRYDVASPHFVQSLTSLFISLKFRHRLSNVCFTWSVAWDFHKCSLSTVLWISRTYITLTNVTISSSLSGNNRKAVKSTLFMDMSRWMCNCVTVNRHTKAWF